MSTFEELQQLIPTTVSSFNMDNYVSYFPNLLKLKDTIQDKVFHAEGNVWIHTDMVCKELIQLPEYQNANQESQFIMFYSALLHDISKPDCTKTEDNGKVTSAGHSKRGEIDVRIDLWKKQVPFEIRESICNIIAAHQVPFFIFNQKPNGLGHIRTPEFMAISLSWDLRLDCLIPVSKADMLGRHYFDKQKCLDDIELFEILTKELNCYNQPFSFPDTNTRLQYFQSNGSISPSHSFFKETKSNVIVLSGIPASGKDSWVQNNKNNLPVLSFDDARKQFGIKHGQNEGKAIHFVIDTAKELLRNGQDFIWNATHLSTDMRQKTLDLLFNYNANVKIVYLEQPLDIILTRNSKRDSTLNNKTIEKMLFKWTPPKLKECHSIDYLINIQNKKSLKLN